MGKLILQKGKCKGFTEGGEMGTSFVAAGFPAE